MSELLSLALVLTYFLLQASVKAESYDEPDNRDINDKESFESENNEIFNETSEKIPERIKYRENGAFGNIKKFKEVRPTILKDIKKRNYNTSYPYAVSILKKGSHYASGALVDKKWILTAAGEFYNIRESIKVFRARLGSVNCKKGGTFVPLRKIEIHPLYVYNQPKYDLALLRIAQPLEFSKHIKPINLSQTKGQVVSAKFLITYWPRVIVNGKILPDFAKERLKQNSMRVSTQSLISRNKCKTYLQTYNFSIDASSLCLKPIQSYHSRCMPDTGAPVVADDGLWGITSGWTSGDCLKHPVPTIATRTSLPLMRSWLDSLL